MNGVRLGCASSKNCPNGFRKCKRVTTNKIPFRKVAFYNLRTINVFNLGLALCRHADSFKIRAWNFTLLSLASYSFRTLLCSLSFWLFVSLGLSCLFGSVLPLYCFDSVFVGRLAENFLFAAVRLAEHSNLTSCVLMWERNFFQRFNSRQDLLQTSRFI